MWNIKSVKVNKMTKTLRWAPSNEDLLRVGAIHDAKFHQNLLIHNVSKIRWVFFFDNLSRDEKS